ncbi:MAG: hypothetical protein R6V10_10735 [bacterium]
MKKETVKCHHCGEPIKTRRELAVMNVARWIFPFHNECVKKARPRLLFKLPFKINSARFWLNLALVNAFMLAPFLFLPAEKATPLLYILVIADLIMGGFRFASYIAYERNLPRN